MVAERTVYCWRFEEIQVGKIGSENVNMSNEHTVIICITEHLRFSLHCLTADE